MGTAQQPPRSRRHQRRPHAMLSQALLGMMQAAGAFQGTTSLPLPALGLLSRFKSSPMHAISRASLQQSCCSAKSPSAAMSREGLYSTRGHVMCCQVWC